MHQDKAFYSNTSIPKKDWERIFGEHKQSEEPEHVKNPKPKPRVNRNNFTNRDVRWI